MTYDSERKCIRNTNSKHPYTYEIQNNTEKIYCLYYGCADKGYFTLHNSIPPFYKFLFIVLFYCQFRLCITALLATLASGKAHTPCRAVPWCRRLIGINLLSRREQAPALRCNPIITQIGRENKSDIPTSSE